jgi:hypothetical protein
MTATPSRVSVARAEDASQKEPAIGDGSHSREKAQVKSIHGSVVYRIPYIRGKCCVGLMVPADRRRVPLPAGRNAQRHQALFSLGALHWSWKLQYPSTGIHLRRTKVALDWNVLRAGGLVIGCQMRPTTASDEMIAPVISPDAGAVI